VAIVTGVWEYLQANIRYYECLRDRSRNVICKSSYQRTRFTNAHCLEKPVTTPSARNKVFHAHALKSSQILSNTSVAGAHVQTRFCSNSLLQICSPVDVDFDETGRPEN
jgi:hypothetical protein